MNVLQVTEEQLKELIAQGVREELAKLSLSVSTSSEYDYYGGGKYVTVRVVLTDEQRTFYVGGEDSFDVRG